MTASDIIRSAVSVLAAEAGAPFTPRPSGPVPEPLAALRAVTSLEDALRAARQDAARRAREEGRTWAEIGEALHLKPDHGQPLAEAAFETVSWDRGWVRAFGWTCGSCGQPVEDSGPYSPEPADNERGHADGCERFAVAVAAHEAGGEDGSEKER